MPESRIVQVRITNMQARQKEEKYFHCNRSKSSEFQNHDRSGVTESD